MAFDGENETIPPYSRVFHHTESGAEYKAPLKPSLQHSSRLHPERHCELLHPIAIRPIHLWECIYAQNHIAICNPRLKNHATFSVQTR